ncbi:uncharacterized protein LOC115535467 [Gadus morhua]|uniref:uncharacterized protein LOC115535467 n=1 Tax=Gadus morhua TaxID=8049 RepID=UPI0011B443CB|nr:uncharacterized protein LOC115535467 [Gadus morhua]
MKLVNIFLLWSELEEDSERLHRRRVERRRRRLYCRSLCHHNVEARHYCQISATVPVLQRFFQGEDTRPDFRLSQQAIQVLLGVLQTERQHGWGPTMETLVFLFWIATGAAYRVVSRAFGIPMSSVHRMVHSIAEEVVAVRGSFIKLPSNDEEVKAMGEGFALLAGHPAFAKAAGAKDGSHASQPNTQGERRNGQTAPLTPPLSSHPPAAGKGYPPSPEAGRDPPSLFSLLRPLLHPLLLPLRLSLCWLLLSRLSPPHPPPPL